MRDAAKVDAALFGVAAIVFAVLVCAGLFWWPLFLVVYRFYFGE